MKKMMRKTVAFLLVAAMLIMNLGAMAVAAANDEGEKKEATTEKVASPAANPKAGTYDGVQKVTLSSTTKDAVIYYTVNGDTPSEKSTKFDSKKPIEVQESSTVKAIAVKDGMTKSDVASFTYTINAAKESAAAEEEKSETAAPAETAAPEPTQTEEPAKTSSEEGEATLGAPAGQENTGDGETPTPTPTESPAPTETPSTDATIGAVVISSDDKSAANIAVPSGSKLADYNVLDKYKVFDDKGSCSIDSVNWELAEKTATTPDTAATVFTEGNKYTCTIGLSAKTGYVFGTDSAFTMNGVAGTTDSTDTAKREYKFGFTVPAAPTADPATGSTVKSSGKITLLPEGATISYKVNDDADWSLYAADTKVAVKADANSKCKVTAKAVLNGFESAEAVFEYTVDPTPDTIAPPTASPKPGTYKETQKVTLKAEDGAKIMFTVDGSEPSRTHGDLFDGSIKVDKDMTIRAIAFTDSAISAPASFEYVIKKDELKKISKVETTVTRPVRGELPIADASITNASHSSLDSVVWADEKGKEIKKNKVFKAGTKYIVYIYLNAKAGYKYDVDTFKVNDDKERPATINNSRCTVVDVDEDSLAIAIKFNATDAAVPAEASNCTVTGVNSTYTKGTGSTTVTFTANGAGAGNADTEGNERYMPVKYSLINNSKVIKEGDYSDGKITKALAFSSTGTYTLKVQFQKEVYSADEKKWKAQDNETYEVSKTFTIKSNSSTTPRTTPRATTTPKAGSTNSKSSGAKTGDETPIGAFVGIAVLAGAAIVVLVAARKKKRTK